MLGKIPTLLLRLSLIMQALHDAFKYVMAIDSTKRFDLTSSTDDDILLYANSNNESVISEDSVNRAYKLLEYFNINKLLLAGYSIDVTMSIEDCFNILITDQKESLFAHSKESKIISFIIRPDKALVIKWRGGFGRCLAHSVMISNRGR